MQVMDFFYVRPDLRGNLLLDASLVFRGCLVTRKLVLKCPKSEHFADSFR